MTVTTSDITEYTLASREGIYSAHGIERMKGGVLCTIP